MHCDLQNFSGSVYHLKQPHTLSLFLFPIVFGATYVWHRIQDAWYSSDQAVCALPSVLLEAGNLVLQERAVGKRVDPRTGGTNLGFLFHFFLPFWEKFLLIRMVLNIFPQLLISSLLLLTTQRTRPFTLCRNSEFHAHRAIIKQQKDLFAVWWLYPVHETPSCGIKWTVSFSVYLILRVSTRRVLDWETNSQSV